ncbi:MAG: hypothetical protein J6M34_01055 [Clostridia bacterium]|nr:hypothetical protein [Clostridia bacterium]
MSKLHAIIKTSSGRTAEVDFPIARPEFKKLIRELTMDDPDGRWSFDGFLVCSAAEGRALERCKNLSEINYYGHIVSRFSDEDWRRYQFLLDAGVAEWETVRNLINIAANVNHYCCFKIASYAELGRFLREGNPNYPTFADPSEKTLRNAGKQYAKQKHGKFYDGYYVEQNDLWNSIYNGDPKTIPEQYQLRIEESEER